MKSGPASTGSCHGRHVSLAAALLLPLLADLAAAGSLFAGQSAVVEFTPGEFNATILESRLAWVVDYYADWCSHCQHYAPLYKGEAKSLVSEQRVRLGAVNCARHRDFCRTLRVDHYPTLRAYHFPRVKGADTREGADLAREDYLFKGRLSGWVQKHLPPILKIGHPDAPAAQAKAGGNHSGAGGRGNSALRGAAPRQAPASSTAAALPAAAHRASPVLWLFDAEIALVYSLWQGTFLTATGSSNVTGEALVELCSWLEFLAIVFPSSGARSDIKAFARIARKAVASGGLERGVWFEALEVRGIDSVPPEAGKDPALFWRVCGSYSCGLWSLFHIVTVAIAETGAAPGSLKMALVDARAGVSAGEALRRIRGFVARFFGCGDCAAHFLETFDSCALGRCDLGDDDGAGAALWLWRAHNGVTHRVSLENGHAPAAPWPPRGDCGACWPQAGNASHWARAAVYAHLRDTFWQPDWAAGSHAEALQRTPAVMILVGLLVLAMVGLALAHAVKGGRLRGARLKGS